MSEPGDEPLSPQGVRAVLPDREVPLECVYDGTDAAGTHQWRTVMPLHLHGRVLELRCDLLPAHSSVTVENVQFCGAEPA